MQVLKQLFLSKLRRQLFRWKRKISHDYRLRHGPVKWICSSSWEEFKLRAVQEMFLRKMKERWNRIKLNSRTTTTVLLMHYNFLLFSSFSSLASVSSLSLSLPLAFLFLSEPGKRRQNYRATQNEFSRLTYVNWNKKQQQSWKLRSSPIMSRAEQMMLVSNPIKYQWKETDVRHRRNPNQFSCSISSCLVCDTIKSHCHDSLRSQTSNKIK